MHRSSQWMTVEEIAEELSVHVETVRRWIRNGELAASLLGSSRAGYRVRRADYDQFLVEKMGKAAA